MLTDTNITWGFVLLSPFIIPILILLTFWFFVSKRKFNFLIAFTILSLLFVMYLRFPYDTVNRNSELEISQNFLIKRTLSSDSEHEVYKLVDKTKPKDITLYLDGLSKLIIIGLAISRKQILMKENMVSNQKHIFGLTVIKLNIT